MIIADIFVALWPSRIDI